MKPKKSLGQNFLTSTSAIEKIVETAGLNSGEVVLEIGPGRGALTEQLLKKDIKLLAIEKDDELFLLLQDKFKNEIESGKLILRNEDILNFNPEEESLLSESYKVIANIPYYITGQIIKKFLTTKHKPTKMVLLVQKEVAERIVASDSKESILSLSVKIFGEPKFISKVSRGSFFPAPNVDSAIMSINNIKNSVIEQNEERFFDLLHAGFGQKRKMILGNLVKVFGDKIKAEQALNNCGIDPKKRAEDIKLQEWICLADQSET